MRMKALLRRAISIVLGMSLTFTLTFIGTVSCEDVKEMDDNASVKAVAITQVEPQQAVFTTPVVDDQSVVLPLDYGKYLFPLTVTLDISTSQKIDKILGFDQGTSLTFDTPQSTRKIHLIAISGVVHTYTISIEVAPRSEEADITSCELRSFTPSSFLLALQPSINEMDATVNFYAVASQDQFPLSVDVSLTTSEGSTMEGYSAGTPVRFDSYTREIPITLIASSGKTKEWKLRLVQAQVVESSAECDADTWERLFLSAPFQLSFPENQVIVHQETVDNNAGTVRYQLESKIPFPWQSQFAYTLNQYAQGVGLQSAETFWMDGWQNSKTIYVLDNIDVMARKWTLSWERWLQPYNLVTSFIVDKYSGTDGTVVLGTSVVDTLTSTVFIPLESGVAFPIIVSEYSMGLSEAASADLPKELTFLSHNTSFEFTVTAENGAQRIWKVKLDPWYSTAHQMKSFTVKKFHSQEGKVSFAKTTADIDSVNATVNLVLKSGYDFPLVIDEFDLELSENAVLVEDYSNGITFETAQDKIPFTVRAQSMDEQCWVLSLTDERTESMEANVTAFYVEKYKGTTSTNNNLKMEQWAEVDTVGKIITLTVTDWSNKMPLSVTPNVAVSKNASCSWPGMLGKSPQLIFNSLKDTFILEVKSESGTVVTRWTVCLKDASTPRSNKSEVINFVTGNTTSDFEFDSKYLEKEKRLITLLVSARPSADEPLTITPRITVSENARLQGITSGARLSLNFSQPYVFEVMAQDESVSQWTIQLIYAPQVYNSDFESWGTIDGTFNLYPSNGSGWITGNNTQVSGTSKVAGVNGGYAAQMYTQLKTMNLVVYKVTSLAAGAAFLGNFTLKVSADDVAHPTNMSDFGVPFTADSNPIGFEVDYKYSSGGQRKYTEPKTNSIIPAFYDPVDYAGPDMGIIATEIHYLSGGEWKYVFGNAEGTRIAQAEFYTSGASQWTHQRSLFTPVAGHQDWKMTHLVVRMSSSYEGYYFKGAHGSTLTVDNFKLIYYDPSADAVVLE